MALDNMVDIAPGLSRLPELFGTELDNLSREDLELRFALESLLRVSFVNRLMDDLKEGDLQGFKEVTPILEDTIDAAEGMKAYAESRGYDFLDDEALEPMRKLRQVLPILIQMADVIGAK